MASADFCSWSFRMLSIRSLNFRPRLLSITWLRPFRRSKESSEIRLSLSVYPDEKPWASKSGSICLIISRSVNGWFPIFSFSCSKASLLYAYSMSLCSGRPPWGKTAEPSYGLELSKRMTVSLSSRQILLILLISLCHIWSVCDFPLAFWF